VKDHQHIGIFSQFIQNGTEIVKVEFEGMKFLTDAGAGVLESFDEFRCTFVSCGLKLVVDTVFGVGRYCGGGYADTGR
jgi:hypothetical protein